MASVDEERTPGGAEFPLGSPVPYETGGEPPDVQEEDEEILFRTPFPRPRVSALRNILATIAVGAVIVGLVWFFDRPDAAGVQAITLSASPTGPAPRLDREAPDFSLRTLHGHHVRLR